MQEISQGERAALYLIVKSGRAMILASMLNTDGSDGRLCLPQSVPKRPKGYRSPRGPGILAADDPTPFEPTTAEGLAARGLIDLWTVGVVVQFNRKERRKLAIKQVVATLTPYAAYVLGVRIVERGRDEAPVWGEPGARDLEPKVRCEGNPYPEPFPTLVHPPDEGKAKGRRRRAG